MMRTCRVTAILLLIEFNICRDDYRAQSRGRGFKSECKYTLTDLPPKSTHCSSHMCW